MAMTNLGLAGIFNNMYTDIEYGGLQSVLGRSGGPVQNWKEVFTRMAAFTRQDRAGTL